MTSSAFDDARHLLERPPTPDSGLWGRAAVLLTRQALELSVERFWERHSPDLQRANMRAKMLCLSEFMGGDTVTAGDAMHLWNALSRVCHYDDDYLAPNAAEVAGWLERAERLCAAIDAH